MRVVRVIFGDVGFAGRKESDDQASARYADE
jgi:hypothetical protein